MIRLTLSSRLLRIHTHPMVRIVWSEQLQAFLILEGDIQAEIVLLGDSLQETYARARVAAFARAAEVHARGGRAKLH